MYVTIYKHRQTMSERIQTIYEHFAVVLLDLVRQPYREIRARFWPHFLKPQILKVYSQNKIV